MELVQLALPGAVLAENHPLVVTRVPVVLRVGETVKMFINSLESSQLASRSPPLCRKAPASGPFRRAS